MNKRGSVTESTQEESIRSLMDRLSQKSLPVETASHRLTSVQSLKDNKKPNKILASIASKIEAKLQGGDSRSTANPSETTTSVVPTSQRVNVKPLNFDKNKNVSFQNDEGEPGTPSMTNFSLQDLSFQGPNQVFDWHQPPQGQNSPDRLLETFGNIKNANNVSFESSFQMEKKVLADSIQGDRKSFYPSPDSREDHKTFLNIDSEPRAFNLGAKQIPSYRRLIDEQVEVTTNRSSSKNVIIDDDFGLEREQSLTKNPSPQVSSLLSASSKRQIPIDVTSADDGEFTSH